MCIENKDVNNVQPLGYFRILSSLYHLSKTTTMKLTFTILIFIFAIGAYCQPGDLPVNNKPGSCYAKCLIPFSDVSNDLHSEVRKYPVYIGDTPEKVKTKIVKIEVRPPIEESWVKKKADKNCKSDNENDCLVWCLEGTPGEYMTLEVLRNKRKLKEDDWEYKEVEVFVLDSSVPSGGSTQWKEVICNNKVTTSFILDLKSKLSAEGFEQDSTNLTFDLKLKSAITAYQRESGLPIGQLDIETLEALGLEGYL